jgi:tetratricopeptide (TPR) repeat protein
MSGHIDSALDILASIVEFVRTVRHELGYLLVAPLLGNAYALAGQHEKGRMLLEELIARADRCGARFTGGSARRLLAELAMRTNPEQHEEPLAAPLFERSIEVLRDIGAENELGLSLAGYGRLRRRLGDVRKAHAFLTQAYEIFERLGTLHEPAKVAEELSALPRES